MNAWWAAVRAGFERGWIELKQTYTNADSLIPTVIVLGDARTNGRPPRDDVFAAINVSKVCLIDIGKHPHRTQIGNSKSLRLTGLNHLPR